MLRQLVVTALLGIVGLCAASPSSAQQRAATGLVYSDSWAVIIGVNDYRHPRVPKLRYAVNDARAVQDALLNQGFRRERMIVLIDQQATKAKIEAALGDRLRTEVGKDDRVFVFFAGHGMTVRLRTGEEEGYLIPIDGDPSMLYSTGISMSSLRQISDLLPAKHILFVVDACYSGYAVFNRSITDELLDEMLKKPAIQILTAGRQGDQAAEKAGHGVFTDVLLRGLGGEAFEGKGWLALDQLGAWVRERVFAESNKRQVPQFGNLAGDGQFVFVRPAASAEREQPDAESRAQQQRLEREYRERLAALELEQEKLRQELADTRRREEERRRAEDERAAREQATKDERDRREVATLRPDDPTKALSTGGRDGSWAGRFGIWHVELQIKGRSVEGNIRCWATSHPGDGWGGRLPFHGTFDGEGNLAAKSEVKRGWAPRELRGKFPLIVIESEQKKAGLTCPNGAVTVERLP